MSEESDLYALLGVGRDADMREIKKAYYGLAKEHHPDRGGNPEKFKEIQKAYDTLSDEGKRQMYDMTGQVEGTAGGPPPGFGGGGFGFGGPGVDIGNLFSQMFGGGRGGMPGGGQRNKKRAKGANKVVEIPLSLKDFYFGKKLRFDLDRQVFCTECSGEGCLNWKTCSDCRGAGVKESMIQIGPGMMAVNRGPCYECKGEGRLRGTDCGPCNGKGLVSRPKVLEAEIKPGTAVGDMLTFPEMCSDHPEFEKPGDILIRLVAADEELDVVRDRQHLRHAVTVSLVESLVGCQRNVRSHPEHPEGLEVEIPAGTVNGEVVCVPRKGMPGVGSAVAGDLLVGVTIKVGEAERKTLEKHKAILQSLFAEVS